MIDKKVQSHTDQACPIHQNAQININCLSSLHGNTKHEALHDAHEV